MPMPALSPVIEIPSQRLAALQTISLLELENGSISEHIALLGTCIEDGFFYLDLSHANHSFILDSVSDVFDMSKKLFDYPSDVKDLFDVDKISDLKLNGYKPKGRNIVAKDGRGDGFESWAVSLGNACLQSCEFTQVC